MATLLLGNPAHLVLGALVLGTIYHAIIAIYRIWFHPLRRFPGPLLWRLSPLPRALELLRGNSIFRVAELHTIYGPIVRISPNELSFSHPQAWRDIYGHRTAGQEEMGKYKGFYKLIDGTPTNLITAEREQHALLRRQMAHGFSDKSLRGQEPIIGHYVDLLIRRLRENGNDGNTALNMREWLNWTTFDIIGDLGLGSPFGCLDNSNYHPWVKAITHSVKDTGFFIAVARAGFRKPLNWVVKSGFFSSRETHIALVKGKLKQRMELGAERPDFIEGLIKNQEKLQLPFCELAQNASLLIVAGSETTATLLTGAVYLLASNPDKLRRLTEEVRSSFQKDEDITLLSVGQLSYMLACLNESLRMYPPVPIGMARETPKDGGFILGEFVPEGTAVAVWQWAVNHDPKYWTNPHKFHPERFMGDPTYATDKLDAMQAFSTGPRNCLGKNLAYSEMRLIMAKIIFNFDMKLAEDSKDWMSGQKAYALWDKPGLNVYLTPVAR